MSEEVPKRDNTCVQDQNDIEDVTNDEVATPSCDKETVSDDLPTHNEIDPRSAVTTESSNLKQDCEVPTLEDKLTEQLGSKADEGSTLPLSTATTTLLPSPTVCSSNPDPSAASLAELVVTPSSDADCVDIPSTTVDVPSNTVDLPSNTVENPQVSVDTPSKRAHPSIVENPPSSTTESISVNILRSESNNPEASEFEGGPCLESSSLHVEPMTQESPPKVVLSTNPPKDTQPSLMENPQEMESSENAAGHTAGTTEEGRIDCPDSLYEDEKNIYRVKWIEFGLRNSAIITQNENGPCPLISIVNILLLRGKLSLPEGAEIVSAEQLLEYLGDLILNLSVKTPDPDLECNINDAIAVLPKLSTGLDVNVKFNGVQEFEYTPECLIFDILHINLYHGWLVDPQMKDIVEAVNSLSYNQLVEKIIANTGSIDPDLVTRSLIAQQFLEDSATQLTYHGLYELTAKLQEQELAVFFRNNHFSTVYKKNGQLYILVTDQGFLSQQDVVWETLSNIEGDGQFVNHLFQPSGVDPRIQGAAGTSTNPLDQDRLLAERLQQEAEAEVERAEQFEQFKQQQGGDTAHLSDAELAARLQEAENQAAAEERERRGGGSRGGTQGASGSSGAGPDHPIGPRSTKKDKNCSIL